MLKSYITVHGNARLFQYQCLPEIQEIVTIDPLHAMRYLVLFISIWYIHDELNLEKQLKIKSGFFFLNRVNISANQMIIGITAKVSTTDMYSLAPLQIRERAVMDTVLIWLPHRKCILKILIG